MPGTNEYLVDTNALLWWLIDSEKLSKRARQVLSKPEHSLYVSAATGWELATKVRIGKWEEARPFLQDFSARLAREYISVLPIDMSAALLAGGFPHAHRDPFDRMIAAQAIVGKYGRGFFRRCFRRAGRKESLVGVA